jgi:anti-sigma28 factor (negative regulator of flagellin synthesis)
MATKTTKKGKPATRTPARKKAKRVEAPRLTAEGVSPAAEETFAPLPAEPAGRPVAEAPGPGRRGRKPRPSVAKARRGKAAKPTAAGSDSPSSVPSSPGGRSRSPVGASPAGIRTGLVESLRQAIARGDYDTPERLETAVDKMFDDVLRET